MLNVMRKHAYSWAVRTVLILLAIVFAFWGIGSGFFSQVHPIGSVNGHKILAVEVDREAEQMRRQLQNAYGANAAMVLKGINLRREALDRIIEQRLVLAEAARLGLKINDEELQQAISTTPAFQLDGHFDLATYQDVLRANNLVPNEFEERSRDEMLAQTLEQMIGQSVRVSESEARDLFDQQNEKLSMAYIEIPYAQFAAGIHPSERELADYYKRNSDEFRELESARAAFIRYDSFALANKLTPSDHEIKDYYDRSLKTEFTHPDQVSARHVLIAVPQGSSDAEKAAAKAKADDILKRVLAGADFAKLVSQYSDDASNKSKGGDLGFFSRGQMVKPFEEAAFRLKPGQSDLVETRYGYHVIQVEQARPAHTESLDQARSKIIDELKRKAGSALARRAVREDLSAAIDGADLKVVAAKRGLRDTETGSFSEQDAPAGTEQDPMFAREALKLDKGDVRVLSGPGRDPILVKLTDKRPSYIPPLKDVHEQLVAAVVRSKAEAAARDAAEKLLKQMKEAADFNQVATASKLEVHQTGQFSRAGRSVPGIGDFPEVTEEAGSVTSLPGLIKQTMQHDGNSYIFEALSRIPPSDAEWTKAAASFKKGLLAHKQQAAWQDFVNQLKRAARIAIDPNQLSDTGSERS
jgi:peptidyl-prolyl cis-trans isomerase D